MKHRIASPLLCPANPIEPMAASASSLPTDGFVCVDLSAASHSAVIVDVRVEFPDVKNVSEYGLVISRGQCEGDRPHVAALYREALELVKRLNTKMGHNAERMARVLAHVAGQPVHILG
ncbi:MAG: hypothetical protein V4739_02595 [Pseudomonadota bacterium]